MRSEFWDYCQKSCIDVYYASVAHPSCNGQVERTNGLIIQGLKARIFDLTEVDLSTSLPSRVPVSG